MKWDRWRSHRVWRWAIWASIGLVAVWAVAWLAVPPLLKSQLEKRASEELGRRVTVGRVDFRPWTLELTLHDLAVASQDGQSVALGVRRLYIDAELQSLLRLAPVIDAVQVEAPAVRVTHLGGGRYDFDDLLSRFKAAPDAPAQEPARFALYNLSVTGGTLDFDDRATQRIHELRDFRLGIPFISNLPSKLDVRVEPLLAFVLNGSRFDSSAQGTPFAQTRKTDARLHLERFDLRPYLGYVPRDLPVRLNGALVSADIRVAFEQAAKDRLALSGIVRVQDLALADAMGGPLLDVQQIEVALADVQPLERLARLSGLRVTQPHVHLARSRSGQLNVLAVATPSAGRSAERAHLASAPASAASAQPRRDRAGGPSAGWRLELPRAQIVGGRVSWRDEAILPTATAALEALGLDVTDIAWPLDQPLAFSAQASLQGTTLTVSGSATDQRATATLATHALPLSVASAYLAQHVEPAVNGRLSVEAGVQWAASGTLTASVARLALDQLALGPTRAPLATVRQIEVRNASADLSGRRIQLGRVAIAQPRLTVARDEQGRWMFQNWLKAAPSPGPSVPMAQTATTPAWGLALEELSVVGGPISFEDRAVSRPVTFEVNGVQLRLGPYASDAARPTPVALSLRLGAGQTEPGRLAVRGHATVSPPGAQLAIDASHLPLHAFEPYVADRLNLEILRADAGFKGQVQAAQTAAGLRLKVAGDAVLEEVRANSLLGAESPGGATGGTATGAGAPTATAQDRSAAAGPGGLRIGDELLSWKALNVWGLDLSLAPDAAPVINVRETTLSDFYARVILRESGQLNLQQLVRTAPAGGSTTMAGAAVPGPVAGGAAAAASGPTAGAGAAALPAALPQAAASASVPVISSGPIQLINGRVLFSDRFIKPNYTANLSELNGRLSAFSSVAAGASPTLADLEVRGRAEGTAALEIRGRLNPLARPLALDISGQVRNLELSPLSPYSVKYAGHGIERGKLSVDVRYAVQPSGQLDATNTLVLNQLSFGDKVEGAPNSLPVKLAVALLADRNGVIDINLPISGSLNDPQFSLGPIIFKVVVNLIVKAITSPFSLLASAFGGGGDELSQVPFAPGQADLGPDAKARLDKVAKALADRPALKLTVVGTSSLDAEAEGARRERLRQLVAAEKRRAQVVSGASGTASVVVSPQEYPALLKEVYRRADMSKPRNLVGMLKDIPQAEMEALLLASIRITQEQMRDLALARGVAVRDYVAARGIAADRLFLGAVRTDADKAAGAVAGAGPAAGALAVQPPAGASAAASAPAAAAWSPRAELQLATR